MNPTATYQLQAKTLKLAQSFASKDYNRPALNGVCLDGDTVRSCDGLVAVRIATALESSADAPSLIVPPLPLKGKAEKAAILVNGDYRLKHGDSETVFQPIEGPYPNLDAVMPKADPVITIRLNPAKAAQVFKALAEYIGASTKNNWGEGVTMSIYSDKTAIKVTCGPSDSVTALLMPLAK